MNHSQMSAAFAAPKPVACAGDIQPYQYAYAWASALTGDADNAIFNWRFIHDQDRGRPAIKRRGTLAQIWREANEWNAKGYGIFATVSEMDGVADTLEHVAAIRAHVVDLDNTNALENLQRAEQHAIKPQFVVQTSPGKAHVYWVVTQEAGPVDPGGYRLTQRKLRQLFDGDPAVIDATRVLRVPGFLHCKGERHLVTVRQSSGYGMPVPADWLAASVAQVSVVDAGEGVRHPLGDPALAAPSREALHRALALSDTNDMDRAAWIAFTAAWKQAASTIMDPTEARWAWLLWCMTYAKNDQAENEKQWDSISETQLGWKSLLNRNPRLNAEMTFRGAKYDPPAAFGGAQVTTVASGTLDFLNISTASTAGKKISSEVYRILRDERLSVGFDTFKNKICVREQLPWETAPARKYPRDWTDTDDDFLKAYMQQWPGMATISINHVLSGLRMYAARNKFNPVVDYLNSLQWDGVPRLDEFFTRYFNAENVEFARLTGPKFVIGMVARAFDPGCKRDEMPIFEGDQGAKKSTALNILAGDEYFSDGLPNLHDKDAMQHLQGIWLIEIGELSALRKSEVEDVKRFITSRTDKFRPAYGRSTIEQPRTVVFAGTTNSDTYLKDPTGARRFWPITCGQIDLDGLRRDRDQLFAEAVTRYRAGERWWLQGAEEEALARGETDARQERDPWHEQVVQFATGCAVFGAPITMQAIMQHGLGMTSPSVQDRRTTGRIAAVLTAENYRRVYGPRDHAGKRSWVYVKKS